MNARFSFLKRLALGVAVSLSASGAFAQTYTWTSNSGASFGSGANWTPSGPPVPGSTAQFTGSGTVFTITGNSTSSGLGALSFTQSGYNLTGTMTLQNAGTVTNSTTAQIGTLNLLGSASVSGAGTLTVGSVTGTGPLTVSGGQNLIATSAIGPDAFATTGGTITGRGAVTIGDVTTNGGTLAGGGAGNYFTGTVNNITVSNGTVVAGIGGTTSYDKFTAENPGMTVDYGSGTLSLTIENALNTYTKGDTFNVFKDFSSYTGNFFAVNSTSNGSGLNWGLDNDGNWSSSSIGGLNYFVFEKGTGNLVVVPEPSTLVFAGVGVAMAGWSAWKKRRLSKVLAKS